MKMIEIAREDISAFADGELAGQHVETALAALRQEQGLADWELYHQIGDVLRSDDMAVTLSPGFANRMAARLDAEPIIIAPALIQATSTNPSRGNNPHRVKRWAMPGMVAAAAMAAVTFVATPQLMVAMKGAAGAESSTTVVSADPAVPALLEQPKVVATNIPEGVVLRDPRIDEYLLAHQRFSPSVYSTAQYARSATFAADSDK